MLAEITNGFEDFQIISNIPYGVQSRQQGGLSRRKEKNYDHHLKTTYRNLGRFLKAFPALERNGAYIVSQAHHYGHPLSFEKCSGLGWDKLLHFNNGGINVNLLKLDSKKQSYSKRVYENYLGFEADSQALIDEPQGVSEGAFKKLNERQN